MSDRDAAQRADESLRDFVATMATAGNPGSGHHELGLRKVHGWILEYDPALGGAHVQAVIGTDGLVHARRAPRSQRTKKLTASEWLRRDPHDADPTARAEEFVSHLTRILAFDGVPRADPQGEER